MTTDLGPMPEPRIEPREPNPGGADAIEDNDAPLAVPDLTIAQNPAIDDHVPDELSESEDTQTEATANGDEHTPQKESSG